MIHFQVNDMTCGHCVATITQAVKAVDKDADISVDLSRHSVSVESAVADVDRLGEAIAAAGYTPLPMPLAAAPVGAPARTGGCCCGGCR